MNCKTAQKWISLKHDGELSPRRQTILEAHLAQCPACREAEAAYKALSCEFTEMDIPQAQTPEAAWADVRRRIRAESEQPAEAAEGAVWGGRLAWAAMTIAVLGVCAFVWMLMKPLPQGPAVAAAEPATQVEWVETDLRGATPMVFEDAETGLVVIWVVEANGEEKDHAGS